MATRMTEITEWVRVGRDRYGLIHVEVWSAAPGGNGVVCDEIMIPADALAETEHADEQRHRHFDARRQPAHQVVHCTRRQVHWRHGQRLGCMGWSRHPPSISELWPLWLLLW